MSEQNSEKHLANRRFWLFLPVLILPILSIFFWLMGGGIVNGTVVNKKGGLNTQLPGVQVAKDSAKDKMAFYAAAESDSSKRLEQLRLDPYRKDSISSIATKPSLFQSSYHSKSVSAKTETEDIQNKIAAIRHQIAASDKQETFHSENKSNQTLPVQKAAVAIPDPEIEAINATLDKLAAIQQPKNANAISNTANQPRYSVNEDKETDVSYFGKRKELKSRPVFYSDGSKAYQPNGLTAIIVGEQELQNGTTVRMELGSAITVNGTSIPAGTAIYGITKIEPERLHILIPSIRYGNNILPVALSVYGMDGLEGINVQGSITGDVVKESADNAIQSTNIGAYGFSLSTQVAAAGIGAAKSLLSKKIKKVSVTVPAGYSVLLRDNKQTIN